MHLEHQIEDLHYAESLVIIPVLSVPEEMAANGLTIAMPLQKQDPYDEQLKQAKAAGLEKLRKWLKVLSAKKVLRTNLIGALVVAADMAKGTHSLDCFTDAIHDYEINFKNDERLSNEKAALSFAEEIAKTHKELKALNQFQIRVALLNSTDTAKMPQARQDAIKSFWKKLASTLGARLTMTYNLDALLSPDQGGEDNVARGDTK
jgi:hypothetical protein